MDQKFLPEIKCHHLQYGVNIRCVKKSINNLLPPFITVGLDLITPRFLLLLFFESGFFDLISLSLASILGLT